MEYVSLLTLDRNRNIMVNWKKAKNVMKKEFSYVLEYMVYE